MSDVSKIIAEEAERFWERRWIEANRRIAELEAALREHHDAWRGAIGHLNEAVKRIAELEAALRCADQFITNGIELGYIRMPDADTPDSAHKTSSIIRAALAPEQNK